MKTKDTDNERGRSDHFVLKLFVSGASPNSGRAIENLKNVCETHLPGRYTLEIIDVYQQGILASDAQIIALPLLIKTFPLPEKRLIGDMSGTSKLLQGLGLEAK